MDEIREQYKAELSDKLKDIESIKIEASVLYGTRGSFYYDKTNYETISELRLQFNNQAENILSKFGTEPNPTYSKNYSNLSVYLGMLANNSKIHIHNNSFKTDSTSQLHQIDDNLRDLVTGKAIKETNADEYPHSADKERFTFPIPYTKQGKDYTQLTHFYQGEDIHQVLNDPKVINEIVQALAKSLEKKEDLKKKIKYTDELLKKLKVTNDGSGKDYTKIRTVTNELELQKLSYDKEQIAIKGLAELINDIKAQDMYNKLLKEKHGEKLVEEGKNADYADDIKKIKIKFSLKEISVQRDPLVPNRKYVLKDTREFETEEKTLQQWIDESFAELNSVNSERIDGFADKIKEIEDNGTPLGVQATEIVRRFFDDPKSKKERFYNDDDTLSVKLGNVNGQIDNSNNADQNGHADPLSMDGSLFRNASGLGDAPAILGGLALEQGNVAAADAIGNALQDAVGNNAVSMTLTDAVANQMSAIKDNLIADAGFIGGVTTGELVRAA